MAATDAPVFDNDLERLAPADRADGAADHAQRIAATAAGGRYQVILKPQTFADQTSHAIVGVGAGAHAVIAAGAFFQIQDQKTLRFHQALRQEVVQRNA